MKDIRLFCVFILGISVLSACGSAGASDAIGASDAVDERIVNELTTPVAADFETEVDYFEAKFYYLESLVETLEAKLTKIDSISAEFEGIRVESRVLLEQVQASIDDYWYYMGRSFEQHCIEDGGTFGFDEELEVYFCSAAPASDHSPGALRREAVGNNLSWLSMRLVAIDYAFFGNSLSDFENRIDEVETIVNELEADLDERLAYAESSDAELWHRVSVHMNGHWEVAEDLVLEANSLQNHLSAVREGIIRYTLANPDLYPYYCAESEMYTPHCPQWDLIEVRIMELRGRLSAIQHPFGAG